MTIDFTQGAARAPIASAEVEALRRSGALVEDARRERPRYFDGRFLAARDLIRDQQYMLAREAFLAQATGGGVATGLRVIHGKAADELLLQAGHGITPAGELTMLPRTLSVRLADIPLAEQLSARFGISRRPQAPRRNRTGLFVVALRPVEFTANPVGAYPSSITGQRTVEDGDIIEATAVVLVPWTDDNASDALEARRGRAARAIFVEQRPNGVSANVLPLAMVALQNNTIAWIDAPMVRRELGADRADLPGLGVGTRALRLAHLLQYQDHLDDEVDSNRNNGFPAATRFPALPPAGPLPPGVIDTTDFTQSYFPAEIDCEFAPIPQDELPALIDEALALPAIDLSVPAELLDSTSVLILAPVPRQQWRATVQKLKQAGVDASTRRLLPAASNRLAARKPLQIIQRIRLPIFAPVALDTTDPREQEWARLARLPELWFVRRRNLAYRDDLPGAAVPFAGFGQKLESIKNTFTGTPIIPQKTDNVMQRATPDGGAEIVRLMSSERVSRSPAFAAAVVGELERSAELDRASVLAIAARVSEPQLGSGLERLDALDVTAGDKDHLLAALSADPQWRDTDALARAADRRQSYALAAKLAADGAASETAAVAPQPLPEPSAEAPAKLNPSSAPEAIVATGAKPRGKRAPRVRTATPPVSKLRH